MNDQEMKDLIQQHLDTQGIEIEDWSEITSEDLLEMYKQIDPDYEE